ncbi:hypothetical protein [Nisaea sp.]|uniref:hypothetical protein n=1 Tax=Nisaea sp. TaxID=2024842 RepID=UPI0032F0089E
MQTKFLRPCVGLLAFIAVLAVPTPSWALWSIGKLTNNWGETITFTLPVGSGSYSPVGEMLARRGDLAIVVPGSGVIYFEDKGHNTPCSRPYWGVKITFKKQVWGFFYDGGGLVDVTIDAQGNPSFVAASGGSQVVVGDGPPRC